MLDLHDVHLDYVLKKITVNKWKELVHNAYIKREYLMESFAHINTFITVIGDIITHFRDYFTNSISVAYSKPNCNKADLFINFIYNIEKRYINVIKSHIDQFNKDAINIALHYTYTNSKLLLVCSNQVYSEHPGYIQTNKVRYSKDFDLVSMADNSIEERKRNYIENKYILLNLEKIKKYYMYRKSLQCDPETPQQASTVSKKRRTANQDKKETRKKVRIHSRSD